MQKARTSAGYSGALSKLANKVLVQKGVMAKHQVEGMLRHWQVQFGEEELWAAQLRTPLKVR